MVIISLLGCGGSSAKPALYTFHPFPVLVLTLLLAFICVPCADAVHAAAPPGLVRSTHAQGGDNFFNNGSGTHNANGTAPHRAGLSADPYCIRLQRCSGHGECLNTTGTCLCSSGWTGDMCSLQLCPKDCSGHGVCDLATTVCHCNEGYSGQDCSQKECPGMCTGRGECDGTTGNCTCYHGFSGDNCGAPPRRYREETWHFVFVLGTLGIAVTVVYTVSNWVFVSLPDSFFVIGTGMAIGGVIAWGDRGNLSFLSLDADTMMLFLLPVIVFQGGYSLNRGEFFHNLGTILMLACVGTVLNAMAFAVIIFAVGNAGWSYPLTWMDSFTFGAVVSSIDPVATLAIFDTLHVSPTLRMLVFGESALNDAVAIVMFRTFLANYYLETPQGVADVFRSFALTLFGSTTVGIAITLMSALFFRFAGFRRGGAPEIEVALLLCFAFIPFALCEALNMSGVIAIFCSGILNAHYTWHNLSPIAKDVSLALFRTAAFVSETLVFLYLGMAVFSSEALTFSLPLCIWGIVAAMVARACAVFPTVMLANTVRATPVPTKHAIVLWFSSMRGAVSFALALNIPGRDAGFPVTATLVIVLFTTAALGPLTERLVDWLGLPRGERAVLTKRTPTPGTIAGNTAAAIANAGGPPPRSPLVQPTATPSPTLRADVAGRTGGGLGAGVGGGGALVDPVIARVTGGAGGAGGIGGIAGGSAGASRESSISAATRFVVPPRKLTWLERFDRNYLQPVFRFHPDDDTAIAAAARDYGDYAVDSQRDRTSAAQRQYHESGDLVVEGDIDNEQQWLLNNDETDDVDVQ
jgi:sodium/hydrogen exchanger 8